VGAGVTRESGAGGDEDDFQVENLETSLLRREREKIITHEIPCRVLFPDTVDSIMEPKTRDPDVNITFPSLIQLKAIADRFTRLSNVASSSSSTSSSRLSTKLELSANMFGTVRLSVMTDSGTVMSEWSGLQVPELNPEQLTGPLEEHPSTKFRQEGPGKFASVRVDGKDLSRVLSVGRLDGKVIGSFIDEHALVLYCYISHFDDGIADESVMTVS
jgi:HUS1 checkpoint protein